MMQPKRTYLALLTAIAAVPMFGRPATGQLRVDTSGRASDANPQIGSGGYNAQNITQQQTFFQFQNAVATNNVQNGYGFRGTSFNGVNTGVGYSDPFAFRGLLAGQGVDQFIANSTGVPTMANPMASSSQYAAPASPSLVYYGASNHPGPPQGFQQLPNGQGYIPAQQTSQGPQDTRLGAIDYSGDAQVLPKPNELLVPGPVDPTADSTTNAQQVLAASPLYGMVQWQQTPNFQMMGSQSDQGGTQSNGSGSTPLQQSFAPLLPKDPVQARITLMRQELISQSGSGANNSNSGTNSSGPISSALPPYGPEGENSGGNQPLGSVLSNSSQLPSANVGSTPGDFSTAQSNRQYLNNIPLPPPGQQSRQYALLQQAIQDYNSAHSMTDEQASQRFQQILRLRAAASISAEQGGNVLNAPGATPNENPGGVPNPEQPILNLIPAGVSPAAGAGANTPPNPVNSNITTAPSNMVAAPESGIGSISAPPIPIDSYASGMKAKGLSDLISSGESLVRRQQYDKAIAAFNQATDVAPNNPLILMARATAELGGGYYAQANTDIHFAIAQDPAVLMGQYNLVKHMGSERVTAMIADLKQIAQSSRDDSMHAFLLAFVYYNSRHVGQAADWVAIADNRSQGQDPAIIQMKRYWNFNEDQQPTDAPTTRPVAK